MACDLAVHLLKQGSYSREGDIVILVGHARFSEYVLKEPSAVCICRVRHDWQ